MRILPKLILLPIFLIHISLAAQEKNLLVTQAEIDEMSCAIEADTNLARLFSWFGEPEELYQSYKVNLANADSIWKNDQETFSIMKKLGSTERFELLPLIDWFTAQDSLAGEAGVSYLIRTDNATILFDVGVNRNDEHPSPLLQNMKKMGISMEDIDMIVISHDHGDHVGGHKWEEQHTFSLTNYQMELKPIPVYTPVEMQYPGLSPVHTPKPTKIAEGVATIGVIHNPSFFIDVAEQALAINVKDKGIVIISGCGHQSISKISERAEVLFDKPIYAVLGGFHFPVEEGRNISWMYKYFVVDKLPWEDFTIEDVNKNIDLLKENQVQRVGLSGHDSCDKSIEAFKMAYGDGFVDISVGRRITLND